MPYFTQCSYQVRGRGGEEGEEEWGRGERGRRARGRRTPARSSS